MGVPVSQMWTVARYVLAQKLKGRRRYPLVVMLEPLFRCNLACSGCGKIQYPADILRRELSVEACLNAVEEAGAPMVSIPGGEPLLHSKIDRIVAGLVERKKYVYLCTNGLLLKEKLSLFTPSKYLSFSVHMDGVKADHDRAVARDGVYDVAVDAIRAAVKKGFRVTTNTTLFSDADPQRVRDFFDAMMKLGVEGMMVSPGYSYEKAPDQEHFLKRRQTQELFRTIFTRPKRHWRFNQTPLFVRFLMGDEEFACTPWGNPTYNLFGWQKPCYLLNEGTARTFQELMETTEWDRYGTPSRNERCADCMVHSGYEPTAVNLTFTTLRGFSKTVKATVLG